MSDAPIAAAKSRSMADSPPPPPSPLPGSPVKLTLTPGSPLKLSSAKHHHHHHRIAGISENTAASKDNSTVASSTSSFSYEDNNMNAQELLSPPLLLEIEDGTPAAEALRANADVKVSKLRKVSRSVRVLKSASRTSRGGAGAHLRNKSHASIEQTPPAILEVDDEGGSDRGADGDLERHESDEIYVSTSQDSAIIKSAQLDDVDSDKEKQCGTPSANTDGVNQSTSTSGTPIDILESASLTKSSAQTRSRQKTPPAAMSTANCTVENNKEDVSAQKEKQLHTPLSTPIESLFLAQHQTQRLSGSFTHLASSAAVAAACLAGEEMDRKRAAQIIELNHVEGAEDTAELPGQAHKSPVKQPFTHLFRTTANLSEVVSIDDSELPIRRSPRPGILRKRACSISEGIAQLPLLPRAVSTPGSSSPMTAVLKSSIEPPDELPIEISVAETVEHINGGMDGECDAIQTGDHTSEDDNVLCVEKSNDDTDQSQSEKQISFNPILVEIPGSTTRQVTIEESKEEEETHEASETERESDHHEALMSKARKKLSRMSIKKKEVIHDDDSFYFHGPKSVRKWVKRRRSMEEHKDLRSYVKGKVIDGKHELYTMSIAVMFGMRTSIGRTNLAMSRTAHNSQRWLDTDHLMAVEKYEFPPRGSDITPPHLLNHTFKFKDYSPLAFAYLRRMFGVNEYDFLLSVCGNANYIEFQSNAKSEQFFFYSPDGKYMIKTMTNTESKFLRRILPHYFRHCAMNPNTLITKFLGMYRVKLYHLNRNVKFVVMKSVYDTDKFLHQLFDVKGSTTGRDAKPSDAVKKDNDIRRMLPDGAFVLEPGLRERLKSQVANDCQWLQAMKIMDYSMLIGVHNICQRTTEATMKSVAQPARTAPNDDGDNASYSSNDASNTTLDRFLDDDDDSYLDGFHNKSSRSILGSGTPHTSDDTVGTIRVSKKSEKVDDELVKESRERMDALVEKAIEDMYWPFHRFYNIQGLRRMKPVLEPEKENKAELGESCKQSEKRVFWNALVDPKSQAAVASDGNHDALPTFEAPLSFRKDGGLMMDTTSIDLPLEISVPGAPHMVEYCDGKIFYMGIIDILQQFNIRKRFEARYRRLAGKGWEAASCVHPKIYADRFIRFFDEYTSCPQSQTVPNELIRSDCGNP